MEKPLISFDYAIKYVLRDKSDNDIIEGFISAVLNAANKPSIKIVTRLGEESNKERSEAKQSLADLIVEDEKHQKYIVEIERSAVTGYIHKACFNTSRLIVDSIPKGSDYTSIKKVYHISLLYFDIPWIEDAVSHGKTVFERIESHEKVNINLETIDHEIYRLVDVLPEYFIICVPRFNGVIRRELDEWLYVAKESDTRPDFKSPYMDKVRDRLSILRMSSSERHEYYKKMKEIYTQSDQVYTAESKGRAVGIEEGRESAKQEYESIIQKLEKEKKRAEEKKKRAEEEKKRAEEERIEEKYNMAKKMIEKGQSIADVSDITGLNIPEIEKLDKVLLK